MQRCKSGVVTAHGISLESDIVKLIVTGRLDQRMLYYRLTDIVIQLALFAVMVSGIVAGAAAVAAAAVDAARLLSLDEHVTHSLQKYGRFANLFSAPISHIFCYCLKKSCFTFLFFFLNKKIKTKPHRFVIFLFMATRKKTKIEKLSLRK